MSLAHRLRIRGARAAASYRWTELSLLILPVLFLFLGLTLVGMTLPSAVRQEHFRWAAAIVALLLAAHLGLSARCRHADQLLLPMAAMLAMIGFVTVTRLAPDYGTRQATWVALGLVVLLAVVVLTPDIVVLRLYKYTVAIAGLLLVATTFLFGVDPNDSGARLWLSAGGLLFQPSEILKVLLVVFLAGYLDDKRELLAWSFSRLGWLRLPPLPYLGPLAVMWAVSMLLLIAQHDLGATLLFFGIFLAMLYVASCRATYVWQGLTAFCTGAYLCLLAFPHVRGRVDIWLDPWAHPQDQGYYQVVQALLSLGSGGLLGTGLGAGYPEYVPAVWTDFVIVAVGEEMGLAGTMGLVSLFMLLVYRGFRIALDARHGFSALLATGLTAMLGLQAVVILAGTIKLIPITGVTLPFVSYGGSSTVTCFLIIGLLLRISAERGRADAP